MLQEEDTLFSSSALADSDYDSTDSESSQFSGLSEDDSEEESETYSDTEHVISLRNSRPFMFLMDANLAVYTVFICIALSTSKLFRFIIFAHILNV